MSEPSFLLVIAIGLAAGLLSGVFGIGGGVIIVPALIYMAGFTQHGATGTSLCCCHQSESSTTARAMSIFESR
jgi:hypothetical protein